MQKLLWDPGGMQGQIWDKLFFMKATLARNLDGLLHPSRGCIGLSGLRVWGGYTG